MLTTKQTQLLMFIVRYHDGHNGVSPSYQEMAEAMGLRSKSGVQRILLGLEERGAIRRLPNRERAIEVLGNGSLRRPGGLRTALGHVQAAREDIANIAGDMAFAARSTLGVAERMIRDLIQVAA